MIEEWKDIVIEKNGVTYDFTGKYQVSNFGRVRSLNYNHTGEIRVMKLETTSRGYLQVCLYSKRNERFSVHRLVATMFVENDDPINKTDVNHIDENPLNNVWTNLEWVTPSQNINHGTRNERVAKKKSKRVRCVETGKIFNSIDEANEWCGRKSVSKCCRGKQKTVGGYHWEYVD